MKDRDRENGEDRKREDGIMEDESLDRMLGIENEWFKSLRVTEQMVQSLVSVNLKLQEFFFPFLLASFLHLPLEIQRLFESLSLISLSLLL